MSRPTEVTLLCEDYLQSSLVIAYLRKCGIRHGVRPLLSPKGKGSAEHWVIRQYPIQANAYRLNRARKRVWLIVVVDADTSTFTQRLAQLDAAVAASDDARLRRMDIARGSIARLVPRRNVETWLRVLNSIQANETDDYKHSKTAEAWRESVPVAATALYSWTRPHVELPVNMIESLRQGIKELRRLSEAPQ
jgi:hypothetical protein